MPQLYSLGQHVGRDGSLGGDLDSYESPSKRKAYSNARNFERAHGFTVTHDPRDLFTGCHYSTTFITDTLRHAHAEVDGREYDDPLAWLHGCRLEWRGSQRDILPDPVYCLVYAGAVYQTDAQGDLLEGPDGALVELFRKERR